MDRLVRANIAGTPAELAELAAAGQPATVPTIANEIANGRASLLSLVEALGPFLSSDDTSKRISGTGLLSHVLAEFSEYSLPGPAVSLLCQFYVDRCPDVVCAAAVFEGMLALLRFQTLTDAQVTLLTAALFQVPVQSLPQLTRGSAYRIVNELLQRFKPAMLSEGESFVLGFVQLMDGEKDPRNLRLAFAIVKVILAEFPYANYAQDLFDITSCYFPISFNTPPGVDPTTVVQPEELRLALRDIYSMTPVFAPWALPQFLEKLSSASADAKLDTLDTLIACVETYGANSLLPYISHLRSYLRECVDSVRLQPSALTATEAVLRVLSRDTVAGSGESPAEQFIMPLIRECCAHLQSPEQRLTPASGKLLGAAAAASDTVCSLVCRDAVPAVLRAFHAYPSNRRAIADCLLALLDGTRRASPSPTADASSDSIPGALSSSSHPLSPFASELLTDLTELLSPQQHAPVRIAAANCLSLLAAHNALFPSRDTIALIGSLLRDAVLSFPRTDSSATRAAIVEALGAASLVAPSCVDALADVAVAVEGSAVIEAVERAAKGGEGMTDALLKRGAEEGKGMRALAAAIREEKHVTEEQVGRAAEVARRAANEMKEEGGMEADPAILIGAAVRRASDETQKMWIAQINISQQTFAHSNQSTWIIVSILANARPSALTSDHLPLLLSSPPPLSSAHVDATAVLLNKLSSSTIDACSASLVSHSSSDATFAAKSSRALLMRSHPLGVALLESLLATAALDQSSSAALAVPLVVTDAPLLHPPTGSGATVRPLYKQRAFSIARSRDIPRVLLAMLPQLPVSLVSQEIGSLLPLVLGQDPLSPGVVTGLGRAISSSHAMAAVVENAERIATALVRAAGEAEESAVRAEALRALAELAESARKAGGEGIRKVRAMVLRGVGNVLDDGKRVVRTEAVRCRAKWYALI